MTRARLHTIHRNELDAYRMPSLKRNPGVVAIMGITNGRGAYAKKKGPKKVGGMVCHKTPPKKHRERGAVDRSHYAYPDCYRYPVRTKRKKGESLDAWHKRDKMFVKRAMSYYGQHKGKYDPAVRRMMEERIAKAAKAVGQSSPKAMEYREKYGLEGAKVIRLPARRKLAANRSGSMLYYRSSSRKRGSYRRNLAPPERRSTGYGPPPGGWQASSTLPRYGEGRLRGGTARIPTARGPAASMQAPIAYDPMTGKPIYTQTALRAAVARAGRGRKKASKGATGTSKKGRKAPMAKKKGRKSAKKAKKRITKKMRQAWGRKGARKAKKLRAGKGGKKVARKTKKRKTAKRAAAKKTTKRRRKGKGRKRAAAKKTKRRKGKSKRSTLARQLAAARALNTRLKGGKKKSRKSASAHHSGPRSTSEMAAMYESNRRRRRGYRRNAGGGILGSLKPYLVLGGLALGGYAVHRLLTKPVASVTSSFLSPSLASVVAGLAVAAGGLYAVQKVKFLQKYGVGLKTGMLVSAGALAVKGLLPDFADTMGMAGIESVSTGPRYGFGQFKQAMAGDPILQAAAGEYYSGTGEYMSSDLYGAGPTGEYEMRQLDVLGDTGAYELQSMYGTGATPTYDGVRPESADTFLEAMAGVQDRSTYIPHEAESAISSLESSFDAGIFDAGNVLSGG